MLCAQLVKFFCERACRGEEQGRAHKGEADRAASSPTPSLLSRARSLMRSIRFAIPREVSPQLLRGKRERAALPTSDHCAAFSLAGTGITMNTFNGSVLLSTSFSSSLHVFQSRQTGSCFASLRCFFLSQRLLESKTAT